MSNLRKIVKEILEETSAFPTVKELSEVVIKMAGIDFSGVSYLELMAAIDGSTDVPWASLCFGCDELLAFILVDQEISKESSVIGMFCGIMLSECISRGFGDWEFSFEKVLELLHRSHPPVEYDLKMKVLTEILRTKVPN